MAYSHLGSTVMYYYPNCFSGSRDNALGLYFAIVSIILYERVIGKL